MKTYTFYGYFFEGKGELIPLSDWTFSNYEYYLPHTRDLVDSDFVKFLLDDPVSGMYRIRVVSVGFEQAFFVLKNSLVQNRLDIVLSSSYECLSNGTMSKRQIRPSQHKFFVSV